MCWQLWRLYWEAVPGRKQQVKEPGRSALHVAHSLGFYGEGVSFWAVSGQSFWLRLLPGGTGISQPRWILARRMMGGGRICGISFDLSRNSSSWWWHVSSVFLTKISCHNITHANGYCVAWSGWAVSFSVSPNSSTDTWTRRLSNDLYMTFISGYWTSVWVQVKLEADLKSINSSVYRINKLRLKDVEWHFQNQESNEWKILPQISGAWCPSLEPLP